MAISTSNMEVLEACLGCGIVKTFTFKAHLNRPPSLLTLGRTEQVKPRHSQVAFLGAGLSSPHFRAGLQIVFVSHFPNQQRPLRHTPVAACVPPVVLDPGTPGCVVHEGRTVGQASWQERTAGEGKPAQVQAASGSPGSAGDGHSLASLCWSLWFS